MSSISKVAKRFSAISRGKNEDKSDEYYTLYHCFTALLIELLARYRNNIKYKVIICPCDNENSVFRELEKYKKYIGNPKIIYSYYPDVDWKYYFNLDYNKEYGCNKDEVLIFTNPPFKKLSIILRNNEIKCNFLLMGSLSTRVLNNIVIVNKGGFFFKNNTDLKNRESYKEIPLIFISNQLFYSFNVGGEYQVKDPTDTHNRSLLFGKDKFKKIYNNILYKE